MSTEESLKLKLKKKIKIGTGKSKRSAGDSEAQGFRRSSKEDYGTENQFRKQRDVRLTERKKPERSASSGERNTGSYGKSDKGYSKSSEDYSTDNKWRKPRNIQLRDGEKPERSESSGQRHRQSYARSDKGYSKSSNDYSNGDRDYSSGNHRRNQRNEQFTEGEKPERSANYGQRNRNYDRSDQGYGKSNRDYSNGDTGYSSGNHRRNQRNEQFTEGEKPERSANYGQRNRNYGQRNRNYGRSDQGYGKSNRDYSDRNKDYSTEDNWRNQRNGRLTEGEKPDRSASYGQRNKRVYAKPDKVMEEKNYTHDKDTSKKFSSREGRCPSEKRSFEGRSSNRAELPEDNLNSRENKKQPSKLKLKTEKIDGAGSAFAQKDTSSELTPIKFPKKRLRDKRAAGNDPSVDDEKPKKKKKRVIRIDPYDTSNKRLDDGIVDNESIKETKKEAKDNVEMSRNAQFRAIQPSPSILSFVEDNMLGRRRTIDFRRAGYNTELSAPLDNVPFWTESERARVEENIFRNKLTFYAAAKVSSSFPPPELPEIAFAGRSNVGKSSMLNALTRQWGVVRTSDKPGLTQTINFFQLGPKLSLVDLPGYGFAYAKEEVKDAWEELVKEYVSTRTGLKRVCLLIDTKWGMKPRDLELIELMERSQTKYQVVLTKTDLVFPIDVARRAMQIEESLKAKKSIVQPLMMVSSHTGGGIGCLRKVLAKVARFAKV